MEERLHAPFGPLILETRLAAPTLAQTQSAVAAFLADPEALAAHPERSPVLRAITERGELPRALLYGEEGLAPHLQGFGNAYLRAALPRLDPEELREAGTLSDLETFLQMAWVNDQRPGDFVAVHKHAADLSGVLYLKVPDLPELAPEGRIVFFDGRASPFVREKIVFKPEVGSVFVFPSWLGHMVYPYRGEGERWAVSFNLVVGVKSL